MRLPVCDPMAFGEYVTEIAQIEWAIREVPQELAAIKSPEVICVEISVRATSPAFVRVSCWEGLTVPSCCAPKVSISGVRESVGGFVARPVRVATCVPTESTSVSVPERVPAAVGTKAMDRVQPVPDASEVPQELALTAKSPVTTGV